MGIFGRGGRRLNLEERQRLVTQAMQLHGEGVRATEIEASLVSHGASQRDAREISDEGRRQAEDRIARAVPLPASARRPVNYYFALGVTPRATTDQIRRFYRLKAREAHPDRHRGELTPERWNELMGLIGDAEQVLTDSLTRRAYDVHWLRRSRQLTAAYSSRAERRGDWATRLLWYVAEVSETEEHLRALMGQIARCEEPAARRGLGLDLAALTDDYESRLSGIRLQGYAVPDAFTGIAEQVRAELTRKQRMVEPLRAMAGACGDGHDLPTAALAAVTDGLDQLRLAHHRFDLRLAEDAPAALIA